MNEVLAVLYFCFLNHGADPDHALGGTVFNPKYHESDLFFSFTNLMVEMRDGFLRELDKEQNGIHGRIKAFAEIMKVVEPHAYHAINSN